MVRVNDCWLWKSLKMVETRFRSHCHQLQAKRGRKSVQCSMMSGAQILELTMTRRSDDVYILTLFNTSLSARHQIEPSVISSLNLLMIMMSFLKASPRSRDWYLDEWVLSPPHLTTNCIFSNPSGIADSSMG